MSISRLATFNILILSLSSICFADQPFITQDPGVPDYQHWVIFPAVAVNKLPHSKTLAFPGIEIDYGLQKNLEISLIAAYFYLNQNNAPDANGISDLQLQVSYQFLQETPQIPAAALTLQATLPTGNYNQGLGNGKAWYRIFVSAEKNICKWDVYSAVSFATNTQKYMQNFWSFGIVALYNFTEKFSLGPELYYQGRSARLVTVMDPSIPPPQPQTFDAGQPDSGEFWLLNIGTSYQLTKTMALQFAIGHSIQGVTQLYSYLGLEINL